MTGPPPASWAVDPAEASARQILPGLWRLRLPAAWEGLDHVNAYLIAADGDAVLVDCGTGGDPSCQAALEVALEQTGHRLADVRALVATHAHSDHVGVARGVLAASGAEFWAHPDSGHLYDVLREPDATYARRAVRAELEGVPRQRLHGFADVREETTGTDGVIEPVLDRRLLDGVLVPSALGDWEVIETPGHAPSHVSLFQRERGLLIAGDIVCVAFIPWLDYGHTADPFAESLRSLDRLGQVEAVTLTLPGHGRPLTDLGEVLNGHRAGYVALRDGLLTALGGDSLTSFALSERLYGVENDVAAVGHLSETLALLRHLRLTGVVERTLGDGTYRYRRIAG